MPISSASRYAFIAAAVVLTVLATGCLRTIPDVRGMTQTEAEASLRGAGLTAGAVTFQNSATVAAGRVIGQDPGASSLVQEGSGVDLVFSLGPVVGPVSVPAVTGLTRAAAEGVLTDAGLTVGTIEQDYSSTVAAGLVISQSPEADMVVAAGSSVDLVLSLGLEPVEVPDVAAMPSTDAEAAITAAGLVVGTIGSEYSLTIPSGDVISQSPDAGTEVAPASSVNVIVSQGPASATVPILVGRTETEATNMLEQAGLVVGDVTTERIAAFPAGLIGRQDPAAGAVVDSGSPVDIVVSLGPVIVQVPDLTGMTPAEAQAALRAVGLKLGEQREKWSATAVPGTVVAQDPSPLATADFASRVAVSLAIETILIDDVYELQAIGYSADYPLEATYALAGDIDASETAAWDEGRGFKPFGLNETFTLSNSFCGSFDGRGHTINGLVINRPDDDNLGIFAFAFDATVKDLHLVEVSVRGNQYAGGIAGIFFGVMSDCSVEGSIESSYYAGGLAGYGGGFEGCAFYGKISALGAAGGIAGALLDFEDSQISGCTANVEMSGQALLGGIVGLAYGPLVNCRSTGIITGEQMVGGIVGQQDGDVTGCSSSCRVFARLGCSGGLIGFYQAGAVSDSFATGAVKAGQFAGGLIGYMQTEDPDSTKPRLITRCYAAGAVLADGDDCGGLAGNGRAPVHDCFALGPVKAANSVGGLVGRLENSEIRRCYAMGHVSGVSSAGGLVGYSLAGTTVEDSFWNTETSGVDVSVGGTGITTAQFLDNATFTAASWNYGGGGEPAVWAQTPGQTVPYLALLAGSDTHTLSLSEDGGDVNALPAESFYPAWSLVQLTATAGDPSMLFAGWTGDGFDTFDPILVSPLYAVMHDDLDLLGTFLNSRIDITTAEELQLIGNDRHHPTGWHYALANDIDAAQTAEWNDGAGFAILGARLGFSGTLEGNGYAISNLVINRPTEFLVGLFATVAGAAEISNLKVESASIVDGAFYVGGLAALNWGTLNGIQFTGSVSATHTAYLGGLTGMNEGSIGNSSFSGSITGGYASGGIAGYNINEIEGCKTAGSADDAGLAGGIAGVNLGSILRCQSDSSVSGQIAGGIAGQQYNLVQACAATGPVSGEMYAGGCAGANTREITDSYAVGTVTAPSVAGGLVGYLEAAGSITRCYASGPVTVTDGEGSAGGLVSSSDNPLGVVQSVWDVQASGCPDSAGGTGKTTAEMMTGATFTGAGWDFINVWGIDEGNSYPYLLWEAEPEKD